MNELDYRKWNFRKDALETGKLKKGAFITIVYLAIMLYFTMNNRGYGRDNAFVFAVIYSSPIVAFYLYRLWARAENLEVKALNEKMEQYQRETNWRGLTSAGEAEFKQYQASLKAPVAPTKDIQYSPFLKFSLLAFYISLLVIAFVSINQPRPQKVQTSSYTPAPSAPYIPDVAPASVAPPVAVKAPVKLTEPAKPIKRQIVNLVCEAKGRTVKFIAFDDDSVELNGVASQSDKRTTVDWIEYTIGDERFLYKFENRQWYVRETKWIEAFSNNCRHI